MKKLLQSEVLRNRHLQATIFTLFSLAVGLLAGSAVALFVGENPLRVIEILVVGAFGSWTSVGDTLFNATPLIFTGLSVAWALQAGLFNIGAEGQMAFGGWAMLLTGIALQNFSPPIALTGAICAGFLFGGLWGAAAGWIRAYRGTHEVLATILLNFISYGFVAFQIVHVLRDKSSQAPETVALPRAMALPLLSGLGGMSSLNLSFVIGILVSIVAGITIKYTKFGFRQRMVGGAPLVAKEAGANVQRHIVLAMFMAGGFAGIAGMNEILHYSLRLKEGFTAGAGFIGIAVALMGRKSALGIVLSAILFGSLQKGSLSLDIETEKISRDITLVIQAGIILAIVSEKGLRNVLTKLNRRLNGI